MEATERRSDEATEVGTAGEIEKTPNELKKERAAAAQRQHENVLEMARLVRLAQKVNAMRQEIKVAFAKLDDAGQNIVLSAEDGPMQQATAPIV